MKHNFEFLVAGICPQPSGRTCTVCIRVVDLGQDAASTVLGVWALLTIKHAKLQWQGCKIILWTPLWLGFVLVIRQCHISE